MKDLLLLYLPNLSRSVWGRGGGGSKEDILSGVGLMLLIDNTFLCSVFDKTRESLTFNFRVLSRFEVHPRRRNWTTSVIG